MAASFLDIAGKHVFITGAAGGIGLAVVEEFLGRTSCMSHSVYRKIDNDQPMDAM